MNTRYLLHLAYQGDQYCGWQWQHNAENSVQATLQKALTKVLHQPINLIGCGRTDAGVHASAYYAHFDYESALSTNFFDIINRTLPPDIAILGIHTVPADFHARFSATARTYRYFFHTQKQPCWHDISTYLPGITQALLTDEMQAAANLLLTYDNFRAFCKAPDRLKHTHCQVTEASFHFKATPHYFQISANRFVRGMVRLLMAQLLEVGKGRIRVSDFEQMLRTGERPRYLVFAPPQGLYLTHVTYPLLSNAEK